MTPVDVTLHAAERYVERVAPRLTLAEATAAIKAHDRAIRAAADFRCSLVILPEGGKLLLAGVKVISVLPRNSRYRIHTEGLS
ncbi:MAG: hypothetical protein INR68_16690 [Methylobacterium mesophilicum]|nr:hypothetical protein [Methylobacterium mesophilicum]